MPRVLLRRSVVILTVGAVALAIAASAWAGTPSVYKGKAGNVQSKLGAGPSPTSSSSQLPFTGLNLATFAIVGFALIGAGVAVRRLSRK